MPIETITHNGNIYPAFQATGNAMKFALPFFQQVAAGYGCDVGCNRAEWAYVDKDGKPALMIDPVIDKEFDALHLPPGKFDYITSSHMLEHVDRYVDVLDYWHSKLKVGGVLCLYLPSDEQSYWLPWSNRKHIHAFNPKLMAKYFNDNEWSIGFISGIDLNHSFMVIAEKA
jgi:hypothetical protein